MSDIQNTPVQDGHDEATQAQAAQGIVEQVRADIAMGHTGEAPSALIRERLQQAGITADDDQIMELVERL